MFERIFGRGGLLTGHSGTYAIKSLIDRSGVGAVCDAQRVKDKVRVAVKVLHGGPFSITAVARERFRSEIAKALNHSGLVATHDFRAHRAGKLVPDDQQRPRQMLNQLQ